MGRLTIIRTILEDVSICCEFRPPGGLRALAVNCRSAAHKKLSPRFEGGGEQLKENDKLEQLQAEALDRVAAGEKPRR
jgi:hypothetical protein